MFQRLMSLLNCRTDSLKRKLTASNMAKANTKWTQQQGLPGNRPLTAFRTPKNL
jgi:hypothetical protein